MIDKKMTEKTETTFAYVKFPEQVEGSIEQDEEWITVGVTDASGELKEQEIRFHDYAAIFEIEGLYEHVFEGHLKCRSPNIMAQMLQTAVEKGAFEKTGSFRILDVGSGGGMVADAFKKNLPLESCMGIDILPEARMAALRDRPGLYDHYLVGDLTDLSNDQKELISKFAPNCMTCVSALGFGDIPVEAFKNAFNHIEVGGAVAFSLKDRFLAGADNSGFAVMLDKMASDGKLDILSSKRFFHRYSVSGEELHYEGIVGQKIANI